jgi:hypothetical protein
VVLDQADLTFIRRPKQKSTGALSQITRQQVARQRVERRYGCAVTLAAAWVEARGRDRGALCFASDSRTKPGPIEGVTKVILFDRSDIAAVWAGDYRFATLLVNHLDAVFTASDAMRRRDVDLARGLVRAVESIKHHLARTLKLVPRS